MRTSCHFLFWAAIVLLLTGVGSAGQVIGTPRVISKVEREALIALYKSTNGDSWTRKDNWLGPPGTERTWDGMTSDRFGTPMLSMRNNNLVGRIPSELGNFDSLLALELQNNKLSGPIPPELGKLTNCLGIELDGNQLSGPIPPELANIFLLHRLNLNNNKLSGSVPPALGRLGFLLMLDLRNNELSGSIPPELGKLARLGGLGLSSNKLSGPIPPELGNLKSLTKENSDFRYNALYTHDTSLRDFLNSKQVGGDWEGTQTVAPTNVTANALTGDSIKVSWTPIRFKEFNGGYRVSYSTSSGGPYTLFGTTDGKEASFLTVTGLKPGTTYYFVVQTVTSSHELNKNTVISAYSRETIGNR